MLQSLSRTGCCCQGRYSRRRELVASISTPPRYRAGAVEFTAEGLLATAIQHEINHLNGKLIIDFLSPLKRDMVVRKFKKQARSTEAL